MSCGLIEFGAHLLWDNLEDNIIDKPVINVDRRCGGWDRDNAEQLHDGGDWIKSPDEPYMTLKIHDDKI